MTAHTVQIAATRAEDWPSHNQELSRKTSEQLLVWTDKYDRGVIGLATMLSVISVLYDTTSGMIDRDLSTMIADIHTDLVREASAK